MSLLTDGTNYLLEPNGGAAVKLSNNGSPVVVGQFGGWIAIAAAQTATGYEVALDLRALPQAPINMRFGTLTAAAITFQAQSA